MPETLKVGLGISTYNGPYRVSDLLASIEQNTEYPKDQFRVVVIDDGSREENLVTLRDVCAKQKIGGHEVYLREHRQNLGISVTWNHLVRFFGEGDIPRADYNVLINDDILVTPYWLTSLMYFLENNHCGGAGLPLIFGHPRDEKVQLLAHEGKHFEIKPGRVMAAPGCLFGFSRTVFDFAGGFPEQIKSFYEETSFGTALAEQGHPSYALSFPRVYHMWSATFAENPELEASKRMSQSRQWYIQRWGGDHMVTNPRFMSKIPPQKIRWYTPYGELSAWDIEPNEWDNYWRNEYHQEFPAEWRENLKA